MPRLTCNPDFAVYIAGVVTGWDPCQEPDILGGSPVDGPRPEVHRRGCDGWRPGAPKPGGVAYELKDQDTVSLNVRVQRNF